MYVGLAEKQPLRERVWSNHRGRGVTMTSSALRRNVAEHLEIASAKSIKDREYRPTPEDARRVTEWLDGCEVTWRTCATPAEAVDLERRMKQEKKPPLTRR